MSKVPSRPLFSLLAIVLLAMFTSTLTAAADEPMPVEDPACAATDQLLAVDAGCGSVESPTQAAAAAAATNAAHAAASVPANCRLHAEAVFWTQGSRTLTPGVWDWTLLGQELAANASPCADYYISIPPLAADKTGLRVLQDDAIRALGPRFHPVAEVTLGGATAWANWVTGAPGRTWFDAGVAFRKKMAEAGYRFDLGETWLLNELDRSTRRDEAPYSRAAMTDLLRGLYYGDGTGPTVPGIVEIGIAYAHQNIPEVEGYKSEMKAWLEDSDFWTAVDPYIWVLTKEVYPDARFWGISGTSRNDRTRHLTQYMEHVMNLVDAGPAEIGAARALFDRAYMPLGNATWPAKGPDPYTPPFCCGHGWTLNLSLDEMLNFVSEQVYAVRHYAGSHPQGPPEGRLGFSWQPTNNATSTRDALPAAEWDAAKRAIASRIGAAIHDAYRQGGASPEGACTPPDSGEDWCRGADVPGAAFTDAWETFEHWN